MQLDSRPAPVRRRCQAVRPSATAAAPIRSKNGSGAGSAARRMHSSNPPQTRRPQEEPTGESSDDGGGTGVR